VRSVGTISSKGRADEISAAKLTQRMRDASLRHGVRTAAIYRDQLRAVEAVREATSWR
jgi:excinuclease ABC subunit C